MALSANEKPFGDREKMEAIRRLGYFTGSIEHSE
jgi:hypothetical protein